MDASGRMVIVVKMKNWIGMKNLERTKERKKGGQRYQRGKKDSKGQ